MHQTISLAVIVDTANEIASLHEFQIYTKQLHQCVAKSIIETFFFSSPHSVAVVAWQWQIKISIIVCACKFSLSKTSSKIGTQKTQIHIDRFK